MIMMQGNNNLFHFSLFNFESKHPVRLVIRQGVYSVLGEIGLEI
jgi:hypothetical protein